MKYSSRRYKTSVLLVQVISLTDKMCHLGSTSRFCYRQQTQVSMEEEGKTKEEKPSTSLDELSGEFSTELESVNILHTPRNIV